MIHPRNRQLKERILSEPYTICVERARYYTRSYRDTEGDPPALRAAKAFAHTLEQMSVYILEEENIAAQRASAPVAAIIPIERGDANMILELELDMITRSGSRPFHIEADERRELQEEILPYWRGKTLSDRKRTLYREHGLFFRPSRSLTGRFRLSRGLDLRKLLDFVSVPNPSLAYAKRGIEAVLYNNPALLTNVFDVQGHLILGQKHVLNEGLAGIKERAAYRLEEARAEGDSEGEAFLEAVMISCEAVRAFALRYAGEAERLADETADPGRREALHRIARYCRHVPYHPPRSFREAVQALWLTQVAAHISYGMAGVLSPGRIDQYLYPFYAADLSAGVITPAEAVECLEELLIKFSCGLLLLPFLGKKTASELGSDTSSPTVGGLTRQGEDAANEISYLSLEAFNNVRSMGNSFTIRLSPHNPVSFWDKAVETYRHTSGAALYNDDAAIAALQECGYSEEEARDYGVIGCVEPTGDGDTFGCTSGNDLCIAAALEMALLDGALRIMGKHIGPRTGDPRDFANFGQFMEAFKKQLLFLIDIVARCTNLKDEVYRQEFPSPFISATLAGCVENARDMTAGGARYNFESIGGRGLGTAIDSLAAIRHFVYETGELSMDRLLRALDRNFKGESKLHATLATRGPRYGCGDEQTDALAAEVTDFFCREVAARRNIHGGPFRPGFFSYGLHVLDGLFLGAMPNGRLAGEPVSNSFNPSNGSESNGPTAMLRSVATNDHRLIGNGYALNLKFSPSMFEGSERLGKIRALVQAFFEMGGMELQINAIDNDTLRAAQEDPDRYRDLVVRVSGYAAYFTDLGRPVQDEIINRTEFSRL
ncbi:MAG: hypothetical protein GX364_08680 [Firmicutes bacterium]|jgi:formate C-acetyltransferase|nr:hypothetical protein [Bacillota bacterium]